MLCYIRWSFLAKTDSFTLVSYLHEFRTHKNMISTPKKTNLAASLLAGIPLSVADPNHSNAKPHQHLTNRAKSNKKLFSLLDPDISYCSKETAWEKYKERTNVSQQQFEEVLQAFNDYDINEDGVISRKEFKRMLRSIGKNPKEREFDQLFDDVDTNMNNKIDFEELLALVEKIIEADEKDCVDETEHHLKYIYSLFTRASSCASVYLFDSEKFEPKKDNNDEIHKKAKELESSASSPINFEALPIDPNDILYAIEVHLTEQFGEAKFTFENFKQDYLRSQEKSARSSRRSKRSKSGKGSKRTSVQLKSDDESFLKEPLNSSNISLKNNNSNSSIWENRSKSVKHFGGKILSGVDSIFGTDLSAGWTTVDDEKRLDSETSDIFVNELPGSFSRAANNSALLLTSITEADETTGIGQRSTSSSSKNQNATTKYKKRPNRRRAKNNKINNRSKSMKEVSPQNKSPNKTLSERINAKSLKQKFSMKKISHEKENTHRCQKDKRKNNKKPPDNILLRALDTKMTENSKRRPSLNVDLPNLGDLDFDEDSSYMECHSHTGEEEEDHISGKDKNLVHQKSSACHLLPGPSIIESNDLQPPNHPNSLLSSNHRKLENQNKGILTREVTLGNNCFINHMKKKNYGSIVGFNAWKQFYEFKMDLIDNCDCDIFGREDVSKEAKTHLSHKKYCQMFEIVLHPRDKFGSKRPSNFSKFFSFDKI